MDKRKKTLKGFKKRKSFLVFGKPTIGQEEIDEVVKTLESGWIGTGPRTEKFEEAFREYTHAEYALAVNSATAGLHLALKALGIGPGDEVITTPLTFCSTVNVIIHCGATPVFADVDISDWNIDPKEIEKKITKKTKAIIPVHLHGRPCKMDEIGEIARKHKLFVVEDAAHAIEAVYHGKEVGNISDLTVFSFYATKNMTTGEGGMVTTNNKNWAEMIKVLRLHGLSADAFKRYSVKVFKHYQAILPGFKYNMTDIQAALGIHQQKKLDRHSRIRNRYWQIYNQSFKGIPELILPAPEDEDTYHARHLYAILVKPEKLKIDRDKFIDKLIKLNIGSGIHFFPVHLHPYYAKTFGYKKGDYPNAEFVGDRILSLPLGANLTEKDISDVINSVKYLIKKYRG
ncbi:MAG: DegT/DnrJ/EryC1/StrS family aminotransferase [Patescibacteria group bacterium]